MEVNKNVLFPNLLTIGNGVCGFTALAILCKLHIEPAAEGVAPVHLAAFATASWLILLGMVFDVFDGRVARLVGGSSALGAQLDSLCDLVTFGVVPAIMMLRLGTVDSPVWWQRTAQFFALAYFLGATLRLARFTAENEPDETAHLAFKGLPSPGAAGCVASLVIFYTYILDFKAKELQWISGVVSPEALQGCVAFVPRFLPILGLILGYTMVSNRLVYHHVASKIFSKKHSFDFFVYLIFGGILVAILPEIILPLVFIGYLVYTPAKILLQLVFPRKSPKTANEYSGS